MRNFCGSDHPGPHMLAWRDSANRGRRPLWIHISQAPVHADTAEQEIVEALQGTRGGCVSARLSALSEVSVHHLRPRPFGPQPSRTNYCSAIKEWPGDSPR